MIDVVRLKPGEDPPDPNYVLIEPVVCGDCEMIEHAKGITYRVRQKYLDYEVECLRQRLDEKGFDKLYVRLLQEGKQS